MDNVKVADDYKDRLFRMIFNDKEKLLELYNAMNSLGLYRCQRTSGGDAGECNLSLNEK